nr:reverse transcriptase domain-containing protein [Tanacetum cinerariifolium]
MIFPWMKLHIHFDPCDLQETMTTVNQGMSVKEIKRVVAHRVANAIEAIAIYETKTSMALKSMSQTERQEEKISTLVVRQAERKRKLDNTSKNNQNQQQPNKRQNTGRAYTAWHKEKKHYGGSKPLCSKCNYHHDGPCAPKCHKCNRVGHLARDCRSSTREIAQSERTKTMKTKLKVQKHVEWCMPLEEEKLNKTLTTLRMRLKLKRESCLA